MSLKEENRRKALTASLGMLGYGALAVFTLAAAPAFLAIGGTTYATAGACAGLFGIFAAAKTGLSAFRILSNVEAELTEGTKEIISKAVIQNVALFGRRSAVPGDDSRFEDVLAMNAAPPAHPQQPTTGGPLMTKESLLKYKAGPSTPLNQRALPLNAPPHPR